MSDKLQVVITGSNGVSRVFQEVTRDAQTMGTGIENANKRSSASMEAWGKSAQAAGAALGALTLLSVQVAGQAEASQARLNGAFENAGLVIDDYTTAIENASEAGLKLAFDDEDVADSLAKLIGVTKDADRAFADLGLAQNIARGEGISLAAATNIVEAAEAGRFRGLAQLGIVLGETATKQDYLSAAQDKYAGASERFASTGAASFERWQNAAENALESIGGKLASVQGPLMALSAGSGLIGSVGRVLEGTGIGAKIASAAMGPAGLAGAAIAAGAGLYLLSQRASEWELAADAAANSTLDLKDLIGQLAAGGNSRTAGAAQSVLDDWSLLAKSGAETVKQMNGINDQIFDLQQQLAQTDTTTQEGLDSYDAIKAQVDALKTSYEELSKLALSDNAINDINDDLISLFKKPGIEAKKAAADIEWYFELFRSGQIDQQTLISYIDESATDWTRYSTAIVETTDALVAYNNASFGTASTLVANSTLTGNLADAKRAEMIVTGQQHEQALKLKDAYGATASELAKSAIPSTDQFTASLAEQLQTSLDVTKTVKEYAAALGQIPDIWQNSAQGFAARAGQAGAALGDAFRVAVGNTNAIGSQSGQVADWAKELIGVSGEYAKIDDLMARGIINQQEYNAAQDAGTTIFAANARIQDDILKIQTVQAPLLADLTEEQARYMDALADLPATQQLVRLGFMDSAESAKAYEAVQLAAAAAAGELGKAGEETASKMITAAAEADPVLRAMLENMGLISVGADGTITVNFDSVDNANASLDDVITAIEDLGEILLKVFDIQIDFESADLAASSLAGVKGLLDALDGRRSTVYVDTVHTGGASGGGGYTTDARLGGVVGYRNGGIPVELAEAGPELLHFRDGGSAWAMNRGVYNVPRGTYVDTAPASKLKAAPAPSGGITITGPVYIYPATGDVEREFTSALVGDWRR